MTTWTKNLRNFTPDLEGNDPKKIRHFRARAKLGRHPFTLLNSTVACVCMSENLTWASSSALESKGLFNPVKISGTVLYPDERRQGTLSLS